MRPYQIKISTPLKCSSLICPNTALNRLCQHIHNNLSCLFCNKDNDRIKIILENDFCYAFLDDSPVSLGHSLIVPKVHVESFFDLSSDDIKQMYSLLCDVKNLLQEKHNPDGFNIGINDGEAAGRTVHHLHMHLIPRYRGDVENPRGGVRHIIPGKGFY